MSRSTDLGQAIVILAQIDGVTQRQLAARAGLSVTTISALARGRRPPAPVTIEKLLDALGATQDELNRVMAVIRERRATKQIAGTADSVPDAASPGYSDDDRAREIGSTVRRLFILLMEPPGPTALKP
jgi:transcriptional regulator with XRE-family HTH domain